MIFYLNDPILPHCHPERQTTIFRFNTIAAKASASFFSSLPGPSGLDPAMTIKRVAVP
jgi:hypothetical protein